MAGFRWPVSARQTIGAPAADVWSAIAASGNLESCHPFCAENPVRIWPGPGSIDEVHYLNGIVYERRFQSWYEGEGYDLEIWHKQQKLADVIWRIEPTGDESSVLEITVLPLGLQNLPTWLRWAPHVFVLRPRMKSYLQSVVRGFEWYVTRGESVPRNQFGTHPWFSVQAR
ncbi:MAG: hypothetical protein QNI99_14855 [Woeseiaceae bacterium]|nr:hypothetical protein [Woeseiaceae bacterium]